MQRPGRTIGLSLAIIASVLMFSILPFAQVAVFLMLREQTRQIEFLTQGGAIGGDIGGVADSILIIQVLMGVVFLIVAFFAWRGKPAAIRWIFVAVVVGLTALTIILTLTSLSSAQTLNSGLDSSAALTASLLRARLIASALVSLYVIWYVNRGPARAFYRGYYLPDPNDAATS